MECQHQGGAVTNENWCMSLRICSVRLTNSPVRELSKAGSRTFCPIHKLFAPFANWRQVREPAIFAELNTYLQWNACLKELSESFPNLFIANKLTLNIWLRKKKSLHTRALWMNTSNVPVELFIFPHPSLSPLHFKLCYQTFLLVVLDFRWCRLLWYKCGAEYTRNQAEMVILQRQF